jgi:hypothetical protein
LAKAYRRDNITEAQQIFAADELGLNIGGAQGKAPQYLAGKGTRNVALVHSLDGVGLHISLMHCHGTNSVIDPLILLPVMQNAS